MSDIIEENEEFINACKEKIINYINDNIDYSKEYIDLNTAMFFSYVTPRLTVIFKDDGKTPVYKLYSAYNLDFFVKLDELDHTKLLVKLYDRCRYLFTFIADNPGIISAIFKQQIIDILQVAMAPEIIFDKDNIVRIRSIDILKNAYKSKGFLYVSKEMSDSYFQKRLDGYSISEDYYRTTEYFDLFCKEINDRIKDEDKNVIKSFAIEDDSELALTTNGFAGQTLFNTIMRSYPLINRFIEGVSQEIPEYKDYTEFFTAFTSLGFEFNTFSKQVALFSDSRFSTTDYFNLDKFYTDRLKPVTSEKDITSWQAFAKAIVYFKAEGHFKGINMFLGSINSGTDELAEIGLFNEVEKYTDFEFLYSEALRIFNIISDKKLTPSSGETLYHKRFMDFFSNVVISYFENEKTNIFSLKSEDIPMIYLSSYQSCPSTMYARQFACLAPSALQVQNLSPQVLNEFTEDLSINEVSNNLYHALYLLKVFYNIEVETINPKFAKLSSRSRFIQYTTNHNFYSKIKSMYLKIDTAFNFYDSLNDIVSPETPVTLIKELPIYSTSSSPIYFLRLADLPDIIKNNDIKSSFTREGFGLISDKLNNERCLTELLDVKALRSLTLYKYLFNMTLSGLLMSSFDTIYHYTSITDNYESNMGNFSKFVESIKDRIGNIDGVGSYVEPKLDCEDGGFFSSIFFDIPSCNSPLYKDAAYWEAKLYNDYFEFNSYIKDNNIEYLKKLYNFIKENNDEIYGKQKTQTEKVKDVKRSSLN